MKSSLQAPSQKHKWPHATDVSKSFLTGSKTKINDTEEGQEKKDGVFSSMLTSVLVTVYEADHIIDSLKCFPVDEIGSSEFLNMYGYQVERLSMQAHATAQRQDGDEYIVEGILTHGKLSTLVKVLLAVEAWRMFVLFPRNKSESSLAPRLAQNGNSLRTAFTLHVESTLVGLLNLILYKRESCNEMDVETSIALIDYCARQMVFLSVPVSQNDMLHRQKEPESPQDFASRINNRTALDGMKENCLDTEYKTSVAAVSLARHLCEHIETLSLSAQTRILDTHDFLILFIPLIDEPPWTRRRVLNRKKTEGGGELVWEKYIDNQWNEVNVSDLLQITKCEAQCWLAIYHLTCNSICRERYALNSFRKEQLLRLRKFLNKIMLDQLPVLTDVMRYMDELTLMSVSKCTTGQGAAFLMQQVSTMRDSIIKDRKWTKIQNDQYTNIFSAITDAKDRELHLIANIYNDDFIEKINIDAHSDNQFSVQPIYRITLSVQTDGAVIDIYSLVQKDTTDTSPVLTTPHGNFKRIKLKKSQIVEEKTKAIISSTAQLTANITLVSDCNSSIILDCDNIDLPSYNSEGASRSIKPKKEWRQLGNLEQGVVLQLGFKVDFSQKDDIPEQISYVLDQAFLSVLE